MRKKSGIFSHRREFFQDQLKFIAHRLEFIREHREFIQHSFLKFRGLFQMNSKGKRENRDRQMKQFMFRYHG